MSHQVTIQSSGHAFSVNDNETVLPAALREGYVLAYGCRNGVCGTCKGRLLQGTVDYGSYQDKALSDLEGLFRLSEADYEAVTRSERS